MKDRIARAEMVLPAGPDLAATIAFLASPEASYITGSSVIIDGGRSA
ncbi:MAG: SDR family oxidoreductase [Alphaproteobacteria bacterium]